jgi:hypothetical protein
MKKIYFAILILSIFACNGFNINTVTPVEGKSTPFRLATMTSGVAAAPKGTSTPTQTPLECLHLLLPANNAVLPSVGPVEFEWENQLGADFYILTFIYPDGLTVSDFKSNEPVLTRYAESMHGNGKYEWGVAAYGPNGDKICGSDIFTFSKPESKSKKSKNESSESNEMRTPIAPPEVQPTQPSP